MAVAKKAASRARKTPLQRIRKATSRVVSQIDSPEGIIAELVSIASSKNSRDADKIKALERIADIRGYKALASTNLKKMTWDQLEEFFEDQVLPAMVAKGAIVERLNGAVEVPGEG